MRVLNIPLRASWRIIALCGIILYGCNNAEARSLHICSSCDYTDISMAINYAVDHDTIFIDQGEYVTDNIIIDKSIYLFGIGHPSIYSKSGDEIFTIQANNVSIDGLRLCNVKTNYLKEVSAIRVKNHKYFIISNNIIENCFFAIYLEHARYGDIIGNKIYGNATIESASGNGIHGWYSKHINIVGNHITNQRDGIYLEFVDHSVIRNNLSLKNKRYGLHFMFSNDNTYANNTFDDNGVGVAVMFSKNITMTTNVFKNNWGRSAYGLLLKEINDATIVNNEFEDNTIGIFVEGSNRIDYSNNLFSGNGWALKISGGCSRNIIHHNNFVNNSLDLEVNTKMGDNKIEKNYWTAYTGYDLNKDNIGDEPHYPVQLFSYVIQIVPESIILLRSFFVQMLNLSEKITPIFTPTEVLDPYPSMKIIGNDKN